MFQVRDPDLLVALYFAQLGWSTIKLPSGSKLIPLEGLQRICRYFLLVCQLNIVFRPFDALGPRRIWRKRSAIISVNPGSARSTSRDAELISIWASVLFKVKSASQSAVEVNPLPALT